MQQSAFSFVRSLDVSYIGASMGFFSRHTPTLAQIENDGWTLLDAESLVSRSDWLFWIPPRKAREALHRAPGCGGRAKLIFQLRDPADVEVVHIERMWVTISFRSGRYYHGHLQNTPNLVAAPLVEGAGLWFRAEHVIDSANADGEDRASQSADAVQCTTHGASVRCYVCVHLCEAEEPVSYFVADVPDDPRPDAWCAACELSVNAAGGWDEPGAPDAQIKLLCGGCYDACLLRHTLRSRR